MLAFADIPITSSDFWQNEGECTEEVLRHVFRSATDEEMPMFNERVACLREAGQILYEVMAILVGRDTKPLAIHAEDVYLQKYQCNFTNCIKAANRSAAALVNLLAHDFPCFRDEVSFENRKSVRFLKRPQILVADLWACFNGSDYGEFDDIDKITMFADYRVPQILNAMGCLQYSPLLDHAVRQKSPIESGHSWEIQMRGLLAYLNVKTR